MGTRQLTPKDIEKLKVLWSDKAAHKRLLALKAINEINGFRANDIVLTFFASPAGIRNPEALADQINPVWQHIAGPNSQGDREPEFLNLLAFDEAGNVAKSVVGPIEATQFRAVVESELGTSFNYALLGVVLSMKNSSNTIILLGYDEEVYTKNLLREITGL